ncbi:MAG: hypothetical protein ACOCR1_02190 [Planctomycetota bacterium]
MESTSGDRRGIIQAPESFRNLSDKGEEFAPVKTRETILTQQRGSACQ